MNLKKHLEKIKSKQEKASFLRDFILNKKNKEITREEAINYLNDILQSESLEEKVEQKILIEEETNVSKQITQTIQTNLEQEEKQEYKPRDIIPITTSPQPLYSPDSQRTVRHLKSFLDRKGLLTNPSINKEEINKQITNYFHGNISQIRIDRYSSNLSRNELEYSVFDKTTNGRNIINLDGKKETLYKINPKEDVR